jgi:hypothetical protein
MSDALLKEARDYLGNSYCESREIGYVLVKAFVVELEELKKQNAVLAKDAARYRWLRDNARDVWYGNEVIDAMDDLTYYTDKAIRDQIERYSCCGRIECGGECGNDL